MELKKGHSTPIAALKSGFSRATGYRVDKDPRLPSQKRATRTRRRPDPLAGIFEEQAVPMLERSPKLRAVAVYEELLRLNPKLDPKVRRTVERRVRQWRAEHGPAQEVIFRQRHQPGRLGISDFTDCGSLQVTVAGQALAHRLYHFRLPWSGFSHAQVVLGGESFEALAEGLQAALWSVGGAPQICRTDSLSAAYRNLNADVQKDITQRYEQLCAHYGMTPSRNNPGAAHENGAIESPHGHLKRRLRDALELRGSRDFECLADYEDFIADIVGRYNARRSKAIEAEQAELQALPPRRTTDYRETTVRVLRSGGFVLSKVFYTVPSQLIGHQLQVRIYDQRLELYLSGRHQLDLPRKRRDPTNRHSHVINYRHLIHSLKCKPMALLNWIHRDQVFPREAYRRCFEQALKQGTERQACRLAVQLLALAHERNCEAELALEIEGYLQAGQLPDIQRLRTRFEVTPGTMPKMQIRSATLASYSSLLGGQT